MAPIHIDETTGSDTTGKGTPDQPYQTLGVALFNHGASESFLTRKDANATYEEPTQSSLKKAKKTAEGIEKKRKKQEELAERDAKEKGEERERKEKILEESKKIVLVEDSTLPKATKVRKNLQSVAAMLRIYPRRKLLISPNCDRNESEFVDGCIACVNRRTLSSLFFVMARVTFRQCCLGKSYVHRYHLYQKINHYPGFHISSPNTQLRIIHRSDRNAPSRSRGENSTRWPRTSRRLLESFGWRPRSRGCIH